MKAVLCPVCNGVGKVSAGFYNRGGDCQFWVSASTNPEVCRSCNGKGWVEVAEDKEVITAEIWNGNLNKCPACGGDRNSPGLTGCPMGSHYGTCCSV